MVLETQKLDHASQTPAYKKLMTVQYSCIIYDAYPSLCFCSQFSFFLSHMYIITPIITLQNQI